MLSKTTLHVTLGDIQRSTAHNNVVKIIDVSPTRQTYVWRGDHFEENDIGAFRIEVPFYMSDGPTEEDIKKVPLGFSYKQIHFILRPGQTATALIPGTIYDVLRNKLDLN